MVDIKTLLPELRKLVSEFADDLLKRVGDNPEINSGLKEAYEQIEKGGRTAQAYEVWLEDYLDQVAVAWVLACVFVRFMEDNDLIEETWLAGEGERRQRAEDSHTLYFREHPKDSDREYFEYVFYEVGKIPAATDLFAKGKTPLWAVGPTGDAARNLLKFWQETDTDSGELLRTFDVEDGDTRFLGDLYQELSERAKKKYALLQTPVFVEEFILDRTLTPAINEFGLKTVRMIDPTCGSGHFLLGGFDRLFKLWCKPENSSGNAETDAQKALDGVWGVDINPFAVAIARFRLIVAAVQACSITLLNKAPGWEIHLATGDSLLFGKRFSGKAEQKLLTVGDENDQDSAKEFWAPDVYACEDKESISQVLGQQYHAVVGNPPYITVKDKKLNAAYRERYSSCHRQYSLAVPFMERFFDLCESTGTIGYTGMITANSYMKREFGRKLIEEYLPRVELTHIVDTSGAFIPGHGTPTVILFGRNRTPQSETIRGVFGIKGEPSTPDNAADGLVWQSILKHIDLSDAQDEFTSTADIRRSVISKHPWSIAGGGAADVKDHMETSESFLFELCELLGLMFMTRADDVYLKQASTLKRAGVDASHLVHDVEGGSIRDWGVSTTNCILYPYESSQEPIADSMSSAVIKFLWPYRQLLWTRREPNGNHREIGLTWYEWSRYQKERHRESFTIAYSKIAPHNHFVLDRGTTLFNCSAPIIQLKKEADEDDHFALLGLLNSSAACFWLKQVSHQKQMTGGDGIRIASRAQVPYEFAGTQVRKLPLPAGFRSGGLREALVRLARRMDALARAATSLSATNAISESLDEGAVGITKTFSEHQTKRSEIRSEMIYLQEEMDFTCYAMFGFCDSTLLSEEMELGTISFDVGMRPFELRQRKNLDGYPVPDEVPAHWPATLKTLWNARITAIDKSKTLKLIEDDHYKRRWLGSQGLFNHLARQDEMKTASRKWLLDRLESARYWEAKLLKTSSELATVLSDDKQFLEVAAVYSGRNDFDINALLDELIRPESVPLLPILRYKASGLRKRRVWEQTWESQRSEDMGQESCERSVPPKYTSSDFVKPDYWRLRKTCDVPEERWISFPHCERDSDSSLVVGWAGWDHLQQATAIVAYYDARKREGWSAERLTPLLAGLDQLLPWIHQWHPEIDPEYNETAGTSFQTLLESEAQELGLTLEDIRNWTPPKKKTKRKKKKS